MNNKQVIVSRRQENENLSLKEVAKFLFVLLIIKLVEIRKSISRRISSSLNEPVRFSYLLLLVVIPLLGFIAIKEVNPFNSFKGAIVGQKENVVEDVGKPEKGKPIKPVKNEMAPVGHSEQKETQIQEYIDKFSKIAQAEQKEFGIPASISLAQGIIESASGKSKLAISNNNHFGIKCFSRKCRKGHCSNFTDDTHKDFFRKFKNPWESWREHSRMLSKGRYRSLHRYGTDYRKWAHGLKSIGYATDRTYAEKLIGVIEKYNLNRFDR